MGMRQDTKAISSLIRAAQSDPSDLVRHEAIEAMGDLRIDDVGVITFLKSLTKDKNPFIKDTAKIALATIALKK